MANTTIYPYGVGGQTPSGIGLNAGTFVDAVMAAQENNYVFQWLLQDVDEVGDEINKMIWHIGDRKFIDALGSEIKGKVVLKRKAVGADYSNQSANDTLTNLYNGGYISSPDELRIEEALCYPARPLTLVGNPNETDRTTADFSFAQWFVNATSITQRITLSTTARLFVILPPNIKSIGNWIFAYASLAYTKIVFTGTTPPTSVSKYAIGYDNAAAKIYVPDANYNEYATALSPITTYATNTQLLRISDLSEEESAKIEVVTFD